MKNNINLVSEDNVKKPSLKEVGQLIETRSNAHHETGTLDIESWRALATAGLWQNVVKNFGSHNKPWTRLGEDMEIIARQTLDLGFLLSLIAHAGLVRALLLFGTPHQREFQLPPILSGLVGATAITEPQAGSDVHGIKTNVSLHNDAYLLNGEKAHITNGPVADISLVVARMNDIGSRNISLFLVDSSSPGLVRLGVEDMAGNRTSPTGGLRFDNVAIKKNTLLGVPGEGLSHLYTIIALDRALYGVIAAAIMEQLLTESMDYAQTRQAFGKAIATNQYVQKRLTDIRIGADTARALSFQALAKLDSNSDEAIMACSVAKLVATENLVQAAEHYMMIHGHRGYMTGRISRLMTDALGTRIAGGTSDIQRVNIFNQMIKTGRL